MNELAVNQNGIGRTQEVIGAEIRNLTATAKYMTLWYSAEIGRRLTEAKELVPHGEWLDFLARETEFSSSSASRFMTIFREYGTAEKTNFPTLGNISVSNALRLLAVPENERESFAAEVDAEHLSTRELDEAIKAREAAERERDQALRDAKDAQQRNKNIEKLFYETKQELSETAELLDEKINEYAALNEAARELRGNVEAAEKRIEELENRPIEVAVQEPSQEDIDKAVAAAMAETEKAHAAEIAELKSNKQAEIQRADRLAEEKKKLAEKLKEVKEKLDAASAGDGAEKEKLTEQIAELKKQLSMSGAEITAFKLRFAAWQEAYNAMQTALEAQTQENREKCEAAIRAVLEGWCA